jgi:hypothetical protein
MKAAGQNVDAQLKMFPERLGDPWPKKLAVIFDFLWEFLLLLSPSTGETNEAI